MFITYKLSDLSFQSHEVEKYIRGLDGHDSKQVLSALCRELIENKYSSLESVRNFIIQHSDNPPSIYSAW